MVLVRRYFWSSPEGVSLRRWWHFIKHVALHVVITYEHTVLLSRDHAIFTVENIWILSIVEFPQSILVFHVLSVVSSLRTLFIGNNLSFVKSINVESHANIWNLLILDQLELMRGIFIKNLFEVSQRFRVWSSIDHGPSLGKHALLRRMTTF